MKFLEGGTLPMINGLWIRFWWRSGFFRGTWIIFQDSLPLANRAQNDILQYFPVSYERILMKFLERVGRLDFSGNPDQNPDPRFRNPAGNPDA